MSAVEEPRRRGRPPSGGREAILDAALALVREEGVAKLTSRAVAARAGVSDASVYYHFKDRRGMLEAVYGHGMDKLSYLADLPPDSDRTEILARAFASLERFFGDAVPLFHAAQADPELGQILADFIATNDLGPHRGVKILGDYLRAEQAAGRANPDADPEAVALLLIDAAFSRATRRLIMRPDEGDIRLPSPERLLASIDAMLDLDR
jgi:AcrR family transcriptional regulator